MSCGRVSCPTVAYTGQTQYIYRKHNTHVEVTIHLLKTKYTCRKCNTIIENTVKLNTLIENTIHLSKTHCIYRKHNEFIESKIRFPNTRGANMDGGAVGCFRNTKF